MGETLDEKAMDTKIKNAFYSVGVEEGFRRGFRRPDLEFRVHRLRFDTEEGITNLGIETLLSEGWWLTDKIICPPNVILIFCREKETEENEIQTKATES